MDVDAYLGRIGYREALRPVRPDLAALRTLQRLHIRSIPFENLSIHAREPIILDAGRIFEKVVVRRRGGFCYELNGLFALLLESLGFEVHRLAAQVFRHDGSLGPAFDHLTLLVRLEQDYLVDVGFGDTFQQPLRLDEREPQIDGLRAYRISEDGGSFTLHDAASARSPQYRFDLADHEWPEFEPMCLHHQTSSESHFTQGRICSIATADGRVSLTDRRLVVTSSSDRRETPVNTDAEFRLALREHFSLVL